MQNLPFLVTQNTTLKNAIVAPSNQKTSETASSFKQVLSKQIEQDVPKEKAVLQSKSSKNQTQPHHVQPKPISKSAKDQATSENEGTTIAAEEVENSKTDATDLTLSDSEANLTKVADEDKTLAQVTNVAEIPMQQPLVANINVPVNPVSADVSNAQKPNLLTGIDMQKRQQLDNSLKTALGQDQKIVSAQDGNTHSSDNSVLDTSQKLQTETQNNSWLESVLPKTIKSSEGGELMAGKLMNKLAQEAPAKFSQEALTALAAPAGSQAALQSSPIQIQAAQIQAGSTNIISAYPGKTGWDQAISQKVVWMVGAAEQSATLTLNPPDLGPLQVVISVNNDKADTTFISENSEVRKALENGISTLRSLMDQAGVQLGQANVSTGKQQQDFQQAARERSPQSAPSNATSQSSEKPVASQTITRVNNGLVDTFA